MVETLGALIFVLASAKLKGARVLLEQDPVVLAGGVDYSLLGKTPSAEGRDEGAVLAAQHDDVGVRLVQVLFELGNFRLSHSVGPRGKAVAWPTRPVGT